MELNQFFKDLEKDIRHAKTKKTLKILSKRAKKKVREIESYPYSSSSMKNEANRKLKISLRDIKNKSKEILI